MTVTFVAISGSLRKQSKNTSLIHACVKLSTDSDVEIIYLDISTIPLYNEDLEQPGTDTPYPIEVMCLREAVKNADGILLSVPENNFLPSAPMKNVIDWLSRGKRDSPLQNKIIGIVSAGGRGGGNLAQEALRNSFDRMSMGINVVNERVCVSLFEKILRFDADNVLVHEPTIEELRSVVNGMRNAFVARTA